MTRPLLLVAIVLLRMSAIAAPPVHWATLCGGSGYSPAWDVATDADGNSVICGELSGTNVHFGHRVIGESTDLQFFVAKFDRNGSNLWVTTGGIVDTHGAAHVALNEAGEVFIAGIFRRTLSLGITNLVAQTQDDAFLIKLNASGQILWARQSWDPSSPMSAMYAVTALTVHEDEVYVALGAQQSIVCNEVILTNVQAALAVYDHNGEIRRIHNLGIEAGSNPYHVRPWVGAIAVDEEDNVYAPIEFWSAEYHFGGTNVLRDTSYSSGLLTKWDREGKLVWFKRTTGGSMASVMGAAVMPDGHVSVIGRLRGSGAFAGQAANDIFIARFNSAGDVSWFRQGPSNVESIFGPTIDLAGNIIMAGGLRTGTATYGSISLTNSANTSIPFAACVDGSGTLLWAMASTPLPSQKFGMAYSSAVDGSGAVYLAGRSASAILMGGVTATNWGANDAMLVRIHPMAPQLTVAQSGTNLITRWPTNQLGFLLERGESLSGPWTNAPQGTRSNDVFTSTHPIRPGSAFFRLSTKE